VLLANQLPTILEPLQPHWDAYQAMLKQQNLSPLQATLSWIKHNPRVSKWVIGVTTPNELQQIIHTYQNEIKHSQHDFPYEKLDCSHHPFIDPRQWPKL
jgi:aryl-alcohol dehydrogenase-like predicted oxidoreductase